ncbi:MAG: excinuclease ABC subunit UvrC [Candidatus Woesearchaeota archaeon]
MRREDLPALPKRPGVYQYLGEKNTILYIGKANNIRTRVHSYFSGLQSTKTTRLLQEARRVVFTITRNEVEALLLENQLINEHQPKYNLLLRHNTRYAWILVTNERFARILTARSKKRDGQYFGPYTNGSARRNIVIGLNKIFRLRTCKNMPKNVCLQYHIKNCTGPCENHDTQEAYSARVQEAIRVLQGETAQVREELVTRMQEAANQQAFEQAKEYRDNIQALKELERTQVVSTDKTFDQDIIAYAHNKKEAAFVVMHSRRGVMSGKEEYLVQYSSDVAEQFIRAYYREKTPPKEIITHKIRTEEARLLEEYFSARVASKVHVTLAQRAEKKQLLELAKENAQVALSKKQPALTSLQQHLHLAETPITIDCFDVSNQQGSEIVAACVRYRNGEPEPTKYRRFNIESVQTQDDYAAMKEAIQRRYLDDELPDLIVIDGGKGQLSAAQEALQKTTAIIALAKQEEEVFVPGIAKPLRISQTDPGLLLLRRIRDSTHNFVISYHRSKRRKAMTVSTLDHIPGVGTKRKELLYAKYKTLSNIQQAPLTELQALLGETTGQTVHAYVQKNL